jgi:hypothetical protein
LAVHLSIEGKVSIVYVLVLVTINVLKFEQLWESIHEGVNGDEGVPFRVESSTILGKWVLPEISLFLEEALVIKADGESTSHREVAELKGELDEGHTGTTAIGFCMIGVRIVAKYWARARDKMSACECTKDPAEGASGVNSATISDKNDVGEVRSLVTAVEHVVAVPLNPWEQSGNMERLSINKDVESRGKAWEGYHLKGGGLTGSTPAIGGFIQRVK